jgi:hypothetical protein
MQFVWERREMHTGFPWKNLQEAVVFKALGVNWKIILKYIFKK